MSASFTITILDGATAPLTRLRQMGVNGANIIGASAASFIKDFLFKLEARPNKSGFPSLHFYSSAAKSVSWKAEADGATVGIGKQGFRQRLQGGTIKPVNVKLLAIPARGEAYGKRAREFGNLKVQFGRRKDGTLGPCALVAGAGGATAKKFTARNDTQSERTVKGAEAGVVMYWLTPGPIHQAGDPSVFPTEAELQAHIGQTLTAAYERAVARGH